MYPKGGARGLQRFTFLKYYNAREWESTSRFTLGLNAAKNIDYIKNASSRSCVELNFVQKQFLIIIMIFLTTQTRKLN